MFPSPPAVFADIPYCVTPGCCLQYAKQLPWVTTDAGQGEGEGGGAKTLSEVHSCSWEGTRCQKLEGEGETHTQQQHWGERRMIASWSWLLEFEWREVVKVKSEGEGEDVDGIQITSGRVRFFIKYLVAVSLFSCFCLILWDHHKRGWNDIMCIRATKTSWQDMLLLWYNTLLLP